MTLEQVAKKLYRDVVPKATEQEKKRVAMRCFNSREISIYSHIRLEVLLFHWFAVLSGEVISCRGASCLRTFTSLNLAFDYWRNTSTLRSVGEFIGYVDLTDWGGISLEYSIDNNKPKCVVKFDIQHIFSRGVHLRNTYRIFLATPTLDVNIYTSNQNIEKAQPPLCWSMPCE